MSDPSPFGWLSDLLPATGSPGPSGRLGRQSPRRLSYPLYLRFGGLPPGGRSSTWRRKWKASGRTPPFGYQSPNFPQYDFVPGVSVFRARRSVPAVVGASPIREAAPSGAPCRTSLL
jgi:hypothetical protein